MIRNVCFALTILIFLLGLPALSAGQGRGLLRVAGQHAYVLGWLLAVTFWTRTTGVRDAAAFWFMGMFPVVFVVYALTGPLEAWLGEHPFHIAFFVPAVEEIVRLAPLLLWGLFLGTRHRVTASVSDLVVLGYAVGGGFAFHEDALWRRVGGTGFAGGEWGPLFPTFHDYDWNDRLIVGHAGWGLVLGVGVGLYLAHRRRPFAWLLVAVPLVFTFLDHARANAWGGSGRFLDVLFFDGQLTAALVLASIVVAIGHDLYAARWTSARDRLFPAVSTAQHVATLRDPSLQPVQRLRRLLAEIRYRRYRLAAFLDLYGVRSRSLPAGDRTPIVEGLTALAADAGLWSPDDGWRSTAPARDGGPISRPRPDDKRQPDVPDPSPEHPPPPLTPPPPVPTARPPAPPRPSDGEN